MLDILSERKMYRGTMVPRQDGRRDGREKNMLTFLGQKNRQSRPNIARIIYNLSPSEKSPENRLATSLKILRHGQVQYRRFGAKSPELATLVLSPIVLHFHVRLDLFEKKRSTI